MGCTFFFDESVSRELDPKKPGKNQVEVLDNHLVPEIRISPEDGDGTFFNAIFHDMAQFERFVEAVNDLNFRLNPNAPGRHNL